MDLLARREHGRAELERKLLAAGFDAEVAADAVDELSNEGLQSDLRFVESFVLSRVSQGKGPARIHADLNERGVATALVEAVLADTDLDWYELAREIRLKKFGPDRPDEFTEKARQIRFLQYRGFDPDQVRAAVSAPED